MKYGILRTACASPALEVAHCKKNADEIISLVHEAFLKKVQVLVFPELSITGYTCGDLFLQQALQKSALKELLRVAKETQQDKILFAVGIPLKWHNTLYNCAAWIFEGKISAIIPKSFIPNYSEFYERRYFSPAPQKAELISLSEEYEEVPFGADILLKDKSDSLITIGTELCEDLWVPFSPSTRHALSGATLIANLSASNEVVGKAQYRKTLISAQSAKTMTAYMYANAASDESTTDMIFSGHSIIALNGTIVAEKSPFETKPGLLIADLDMERIAQERERTTTFQECANTTFAAQEDNHNIEEIELPDTLFADFGTKNTIGFSAQTQHTADFVPEELFFHIDSHPFVPNQEDARKERCKSVIEMQAAGLSKRIRHINTTSAVIGLSGGLDSTLALLVTVRSFDMCNINRSNIQAITMPCFGTTNRTYDNACALAKALGVSLSRIDIKEAVLQHFKDIGQNPETHDVTYENCQARERTQILMDSANKTNGIVIGTGDLSELALGWCTYNGDHMSMYGVNSSIPKTLVRYLVSWFAQEAQEAGQQELSAVLSDILDTPVSPELLPPTNGTISQKTEELVGPYDLHDFFLYYMLRWGFGPQKIFFLARLAFKKEYDSQTILTWLKTFYKRFFSQQFKRSCMPDGAKVGTVSLSPRGDWRMPSDASSALWTAELEELVEKEENYGL